MERRELKQQLNILEREKRWMGLSTQTSPSSDAIKPTWQALPVNVGEDKLINPGTMRARELLFLGMKRSQYGLALVAEVLDHASDIDWKKILMWLQDHPYGLKVNDKKRSATKQKRDKIDIETELQAELQSAQSQPVVEEWVGPHRYDAAMSLLSQTQIVAEEGINCQVLVHAVAEFLGSPLPRSDRSRELFLKEEYRFIDVHAEPLPIGAVLFFHERPVIADPAALHLAVCVGYDKGGVPWVLHATSQMDKTRPAAEIVPISYVLTNRLRHYYGAVHILKTQPQSSTAQTSQSANR